MLACIALNDASNFPFSRLIAARFTLTSAVNLSDVPLELIVRRRTGPDIVLARIGRAATQQFNLSFSKQDEGMLQARGGNANLVGFYQFSKNFKELPKGRQLKQILHTRKKPHKEGQAQPAAPVQPNKQTLIEQKQSRKKQV